MTSGQHNDPQWLTQARSTLDEAAEKLDAQAVCRLSRIRHAAISGNRNKPRPAGGYRLVTVAASVVILVLAFGFGPDGVWKMADSSAISAAASAFDDIELLTASESLDFYQEFEFYLWLAEHDTSI
jgi:hypothetical protein